MGAYVVLSGVFCFVFKGKKCTGVDAYCLIVGVG